MKQLVALLFLAAGLQVSAQASDWAGFADDSSADLRSVDLSSIKKMGKYTKAWFRDLYYVQRKTLELTGKDYDTEMYLVYFDCRTKESATIQRHFYLGAEYVSGNVYPVSRQLFSDVIPDSVGETELNIACSKNPKAFIAKMQPKRSSSLDIKAMENALGVSGVQPTRPRAKNQLLNGK